MVLQTYGDRHILQDFVTKKIIRKVPIVKEFTHLHHTTNKLDMPYESVSSNEKLQGIIDPLTQKKR